MWVESSAYPRFVALVDPDNLVLILVFVGFLELVKVIAIQSDIWSLKQIGI
jgi:hypothetical protein